MVTNTTLEESLFEAFYQAETKKVETWFQSPRFSGLTRPYSASSVVSLRGTFPQSYASNGQALKLWRLLNDHAENGTSSITFGALDPIQVVQMAKYCDTVYVSGWQCSSTASTSNGITFTIDCGAKRHI